MHWSNIVWEWFDQCYNHWNSNEDQWYENNIGLNTLHSFYITSYVNYFHMTTKKALNIFNTFALLYRLRDKDINITNMILFHDVLMPNELTNADYEISRNSDGIFGGLNDVRKNKI